MSRLSLTPCACAIQIMRADVLHLFGASPGRANEYSVSSSPPKRKAEDEGKGAKDKKAKGGASKAGAKSKGKK